MLIAELVTDNNDVPKFTEKIITTDKQKRHYFYECRILSLDEMKEKIVNNTLNSYCVLLNADSHSENQIKERLFEIGKTLESLLTIPADKINSEFSRKAYDEIISMAINANDEAILSSKIPINFTTSFDFKRIEGIEREYYFVENPEKYTVTTADISLV